MSIDKSALDPYRQQSRKCFEFIRSLLPDEPVQRVEKASIDEVFLDLSAQVHNILLEQFPELAEQPAEPEQYLPLPSFSSPLDWEGNHVVGIESADPRPDWDDIAFNIGADIVRRIRAETLKHFHYTCSAGIACNKMLAKLGAGFKKPNQQTVVPNRSISEFLTTHVITKIRGLGGKLGLQVADMFGSNRVADIVRISREEMIARLGEESGCWVYDIVRGKETGIVTSRTTVQSMLSAKTFTPSVVNIDQAMKWLRIFAADLMSRLNELQAECPRRPTVVALHHHIRGRFGPTRSKQATIPSGSTVDEMTLFTYSRDLLRHISDEGSAWPCASLSVSISGFQDLVTQNHRITSFFTKKHTNKRGANEASTKDENQIQQPKRARMLGNYGLFAEEEETSLAHEFQAGRVAEAMSVQLEDVEADHTVDYDCPKCGKGIQASKVLEHLDWHIALDVQELGE